MLIVTFKNEYEFYLKTQTTVKPEYQSLSHFGAGLELIEILVFSEQRPGTCLQRSLFWDPEGCTVVLL
jgi:hypothetical protein